MNKFFQEKEHNDPVRPKVKKNFVIEYKYTDEAIERKIKEKENPWILFNAPSSHEENTWKVFQRYKSQRALDDAFEALIEKQKGGWMIGDKKFNYYDNYIFRKAQ